MPTDFDIHQQHVSEKQYVPIDNFAVWKWRVSPKKEDLHKIEIRAIVVLDPNPPKEYVVYSKIYDIEANLGHTGQEIMREYLPAIIGAIITAIVGLFIWYLKRKFSGSGD